MSLVRHYRNADIIFDDHENLLDFDKEFRLTCKILDDYLNNISKRYNEGLFKDDTTLFLRVAPSSALTIYVGISKDNNPYIFTYNAIDKIVSKDIPYYIFSRIGKEPYIYMLEDAIKAEGLGKYKVFETPSIKSQILTLVNTYDLSLQNKKERNAIDRFNEER